MVNINSASICWIYVISGRYNNSFPFARTTQSNKIQAILYVKRVLHTSFRHFTCIYPKSTCLDYSYQLIFLKPKSFGVWPSAFLQMCFVFGSRNSPFMNQSSFSQKNTNPARIRLHWRNYIQVQENGIFFIRRSALHSHTNREIILLFLVFVEIQRSETTMNILSQIKYFRAQKCIASKCIE